MRLQRIIAATLILTAHMSTAWADPAELRTTQIIRTSASGLALNGTLTANVMRQEAYQEQVPYQDTETYYENVPYQDQEAYTDYEDYWSNDYICRPYTDYENRCNQERYCTNLPDRRECRTERRCDQTANDEMSLIDKTLEIAGAVTNRDRGGGPAPYPGGGGGGGRGGGNGGGHGGGGGWPGGGGGGPRPQPPRCSERQVCHTVPGGQRCDYRNVCRQVPVARQRCGYEQTRHSRAVTRYRTVTRYRQEARTRTVTRYRPETRYRQVFDHQFVMNASVQFPIGTQLVGNQQELFTITLIGDEQAADINLTFDRVIYGYVIESKSVVGNTAVIKLRIP